jgi:hypothetical protein
MDIGERIRAFLDSWPKIKQQLEELTETPSTMVEEEEGEAEEAGDRRKGEGKTGAGKVLDAFKHA